MKSKHTIYTIVYYWHGERHRGLDYPNVREASAACQIFVKKGWVAYVEKLTRTTEGSAR